MDNNTICALLINATLCLMILLSYSFADNFELNTSSQVYGANETMHQVLDVSVKTHKKSINKIVKHKYHRLADSYNWTFDRSDALLFDETSTEISSWEILTGSVSNDIGRHYMMILASLYPEHLSKIGLPDELQKMNNIDDNYRLHFGENDQVFGSASTTLHDQIELYENSKISTQSIVFQFIGDQQTADYVNRDFTRLWFRTKSEAFISENHLVLISWNELDIDKRNNFQRLRLRDTLGRETSVRRRPINRVARVYQSPRLVFLQPIDSSRGTTDYSDLLACANSFSILMNIIIATLLLEITRNGLHGHYKFSHV